MDSYRERAKQQEKLECGGGGEIAFQLQSSLVKEMGLNVKDIEFEAT